MKKTIKFEVEEGNTQCSYEGCPIYNSCDNSYKYSPLQDLCAKYNLLTLEFIKEENDENKI